MITRRPADERGQTRTDWLDSRHTFSFNRYYDPRFVGFRDLLVINEDFVAPSKGFGTHSHRDMEIITYVVEGALQHKDSMGNTSVIRPGEVQRMSAGTGVMHSEYNPSADSPVHLLQIWITPEREGMRPSYEQREFPDAGRRGRLRLIASRAGRDGSVTVHQDAEVYDATLREGEEVAYELRAGRHAWVQLVSGFLRLNDVELKSGDGAAVGEEARLLIRAGEPSEILLFDLA
ncbi:MAG: quercetin 2,3-dioxygenase [Acidobacteria bacterium]|nr:MAG: quercetin 2,3-dioxygenase [Acidobacteriota bacterium]